MALTKLPIRNLTNSLLKFGLPSLNSQTLKTIESSSSGCFHTHSGLFAGHAKWQNIKFIKAARDQSQAAISQRLAREIQILLTKDPNPDPKLNPALAAVLQKARKNQISNDMINKTIDRVVKLKDPKNITAFQGRGPGNAGIIVECFSPKPHHTKGQLQAIARKFGFNMMSSAQDLFRHTGYIEAKLPEDELKVAEADPENFNIDKYVDLAIEVGAEDVTLEPGESGPILRFECHPHSVALVSRKIEEESSLVLDSLEARFVPTVEVPATKEHMENMDKLLAKLELFPEFMKFYTNVVPEDGTS